MKQKEVMRVSGLDALLARVPALVGFTPEDSIVVIGLTSENRLVLTSRVDLSADHDYGIDMVPAMGQAKELYEIESVVVVGYTNDQDTAAAEGVLDRIVTGFYRVGLFVLDMVIVSGGRYRSLFCDPDDCTCPPEGFVLSAQVDAEQMGRVRGMVEHRGELVDQLKPDPMPDREVEVEPAKKVFEELQFPGARWALSMGLWNQFFDGADLDEKQEIMLGVALTSLDVRDWCFTRLLEHDSKQQSEFMDRVIGLIRRLPESVTPNLLCAVALCAWRQGDGAQANVALERIEEIDPQHKLANLITEALAQALPPQTVDEMLTVEVKA